MVEVSPEVFALSPLLVFALIFAIGSLPQFAAFRRVRHSFEFTLLTFSLILASAAIYIKGFYFFVVWFTLLFLKCAIIFSCLIFLFEVAQITRTRWRNRITTRFIVLDAILLFLYLFISTDSLLLAIIRLFKDNTASLPCLQIPITTQKLLNSANVLIFLTLFEMRPQNNRPVHWIVAHILIPISDFLHSTFNLIKRTSSAIERRISFELLHPDAKMNILFEKIIKGKKDVIECGACLEKKTSKRVPKFKSCEHRMCYPCTQSYIKECSNSPEGTFLDCPYEPQLCASLGDHAVNTFLQSKDIRIDATEMRNKLNKAYIRAALLNMQNVMRCPGPDCLHAAFTEEQPSENAFLIDPNKETVDVRRITEIPIERNDTFSPELDIPKIPPYGSLNLFKVNENGVDLRKFKCEACNLNSCVVCKKPWTYGVADHSQKTCEEYNTLGMFDSKDPETILTTREIEELKAKGLAKPCPKCLVLIEKNMGCKIMICSQCKQEFCWVCLQKNPTCACILVN